MRRLRLTAVAAVLAMVASACGVLGLAGVGNYEITAEVARTFNLFPGSPVRVLGVAVGTVTDIGIDEGDESITVTMRVDNDIVLPADVQALVITESLLGERFVQLHPPYTGGPAFEPGGNIPRFYAVGEAECRIAERDPQAPCPRTSVPFEFDEVLEGLNSFVGGLDPDEIGRLVDNLADVLEGQGETLGTTIEQARVAVGVLREHDEQIVRLAARLADLNETLATRDQALGRIIEDWNTVAGTIVRERADLDAALVGLARLSAALADLLEDHRPGLERDIQTVTRLGRTAARNLGQIERAVIYTAELFRGAETNIVRDPHYWLPLLNSVGPLVETQVDSLTQSLVRRLAFLCEGAPPGDLCDELLDVIDDLLPSSLCLPPLIPCPAGAESGAVPLGTALADATERHPGLLERILEHNGLNDAGDDMLRRLLGNGRSAQ